MPDDLDLKTTELTGLIGREAIDRLESLHDPANWRAYRETYARASALEVVTPYPLQIDFELNPTCNLACPMCPLSAETNKDKPSSTWFPFETYKAVVEDGVPKGLRAVKLNYVNEPLMRKDLPAFIECARNAGVLDVYLSTNGLLITEARAEALVRAGLHRIQVSIDATSEDTYAQVRPGGKLAKVMANVELLKRVRDRIGSLIPLIRVNFVRTELNEHELTGFIDYWRDRVEMIGVQEMVDPPKSARKIRSRTTANKKKTGFRCSFPYKQLVITSEGWILPCCTFHGERLKIGHIDEMTVDQAWNDFKMFFLRELHGNGRYAMNHVCRDCVDGSLVLEED